MREREREQVSCEKGVFTRHSIQGCTCNRVSLSCVVAVLLPCSSLAGPPLLLPSCCAKEAVSPDERPALVVLISRGTPLSLHTIAD